jgi:DNA-binding NarL/FixJ family response regulator
MALRIIIADDHPLLVDGLKRMLEEMDGVEVPACTDNGLQLLGILRESPVDIVLLDLHMPKLDGIDTLKILKKEFPKLKVIVFTNYNQPKLVKEIKLLGAEGFLLKNSPPATIKEAVQSIAMGGIWFQEMTSEKPVSSLLTNDFMKKYQLTERETEIICKVAEGYTTKEIANQLFLSEFTVNTHRRNIGRKLNIYTPVGLFNFAKVHGLV